MPLADDNNCCGELFVLAEATVQWKYSPAYSAAAATRINLG